MGRRSLKVTRERVQAAGKRISYEAAGSGDPIVLVHGLSGSTQWWSRNVRALAKRYRVFLVDLPGFGTMRQPLRSYPLSKAATWLKAWMEAVGLERAHLVGHSMGAYISIRLAAASPQLVDRLILVTPGGFRMRRSQLGYVLPLLKAIRHTTPAFLPVLARDAVRAGPLALWRAGRELLAEDIEEDLAAVTAPVLLLFGEKDTLVPPSIGPIMRNMISNSQLLVMRGAGHVPMFDRPREFNAAVLAFLAGKQVGEQSGNSHAA
jgi:pimeloyl-ACP methyl ester carboxylesterase